MDIAALGLRVEGVQELERLLAAMEKLEKQQGQTEKSQKGLNEQQKQSKKPLEDSKKAAEQLTEAERRLAEQAERAGMSVNGMKAALRGLPAQFTDIAVSLQGGQAPLTVFLQQGGQLKDMFGGAGVAARAMAGYITGLINPFSLAAAAVAALGVAYYQGSREQDAFRVSLAATGNAIGETTGSLAAYSKQIAESTSTQGKASESLNLFVQAGVRAEGELARFTETAIRWEKATGEGVDAVAEKFSALQKDPVASALKLNESMNFLTLSTYEQIKALEDQDDAAGASALAMSELDRAMAERSKNIEQNLGSIERGWNAVASAAKGAWDWMLNVGRQASLTERLATEQEKLLKLETEIVGLYEKGTHSKRLSEQRERVQLLMDEYAQSELNAAADKTRKEEVDALSGAYKEYGKYLKDDLSLSQTLSQAKEKLTKAKVKEADIEKILAGITEEYNKKNKTRVTSTKAIENSYRTLAERAAEYVKSLELEAQQGEKISKSQQLEIELQSLIIRGKGKGTDAAVASTKALIAEAKAMETQAKARKEYAEAIEYTDKTLADYAEKQQKSLAQVSEQIEKLRQEEEAHALAAQKNVTHAEAVEMLTIARLEEYRAQMQAGAGSQTEIDRIEKEIAARKELLGVMGTKIAREATEKAADDAKKEWEDVNRYIEDGLYDAIVTGGASAGEALERMFKNLVLQPIVKAGIQSLMGAVGLGDTSSSGGALSAASNVQSLYNAFSGGLTSTIGGAIGQLGATFGSSALTSFAAGMKGSTLAAGLAGPTTAGASGAMGLGASVGAALPWVAGGLAIASLVSSFMHKETPHAGAASQYAGGQITAGGKQFTRNAINADYIGEMQSTMDSLAFTLGSTLDGLDKIFGGSGGFSVTTGFKADSDDPSNATLQISNAVGDTLVKWLAQRSGEFGSRATGQSYDSDPSKGMDEYLKAVTAATIPQFKAIVPQWADAMLDSFGQSIGFSGNASDWESISASGADAMQALQQVAEQIAQFEKTLKSLGDTMPVLANLSDDVVSQMIEAAGSFDTFGSIISGFYESFTSESEKLENARSRLSEATGIDPAIGEEAKAQFEQTVKDAIASGNGALATSLMALAPAFKEVADQADKITGSAANLTKRFYEFKDGLIDLESRFAGGGLSRQYKAEDASVQLSSLLSGTDFAESAASIYDRMLTATSAEVETYFREVLNSTLGNLSFEDNSALVGLTNTMLDLAQASDEAAQAERDRLQAISDQRAGLEQQIMQLTGDTAGLLALERAAIDESNHDLFDRIQALKAEQEATQKSAEAAQEAANAAQEVANAAQQLADAFNSVMSNLGSSEFSLQSQLMELQGDSAGATARNRARELEQLLEGITEAAMRAQIEAAHGRVTGLQDEIQALREATAAAQEAAQAQAQIDSERASLEQQLMLVMGDTAGLREIERSALDESNRALFDHIKAIEDQQAAEAERVRIEEEAAQKAKAIAQERFGLESQLLQLQGDTAAIRERELEALDPSNHALQEHIWALQDEQKAAIEAQTAIDAMAQSFRSVMQGLAEESFALESQVMRLQGDEAGATSRERGKELADLLEGISDVDMQSQIKAAHEYQNSLKDQIATLEKASAVAQERAGLEAKILSLEGDTASIRAQELGLLDPSNQALQERIWAIEAEQEAARIAAEIAQERAGLETQIAQLVDDSAKIRQQELDAIDPSNRALQEMIYSIEDMRAAAQSAAQSMSTAWSSFSAVSSIAAQELGNSSGLSKQLELMRQSYAGADSTEGRVAALQQIIGLEQNIWNLEQERKTTEINALQEQIGSLQELASAAKGLRSYASELYAGSSEAAATATYQALIARAKRGDVEAIGNLSGAASAQLGIAEGSARTQVDFARATLSMAGELASIADKQALQAQSEQTRLERQSVIAEESFKVSQSTESLINSLLAETQKAFTTEARDAARLITNSDITNELLASLPAELAGLIGAGFVNGSHADGLASVPFDGYIAKLHKGEAVVPAQYNPYTNGSSTSSENVASLLRSLISDNRVQAGSVISALTPLLRIVQRWDGDGLPEKREEMA